MSRQFKGVTEVITTDSSKKESKRKLGGGRGMCKKDWTKEVIPEGFVVNPRTNRLIRIGSVTYKKMKSQVENGEEPVVYRDEMPVVYEGPNAGEVKKSLKMPVPKNKVLKVVDNKVKITVKPKSHKEVEERHMELALKVFLENEHLRSQMSDSEFEALIKRKVQQKAVDPDNKFATPKTKKIVAVSDVSEVVETLEETHIDESEESECNESEEDEERSDSDAERSD